MQICLALIGGRFWVVKRGADMDSALTTGRYEVKMFGEFSIRKGDVFVSKDQSRTKKVWMLLEYLIANRHSEISQEKLIDLLWGEEGCDSPLNALKNLVYRCRKMLSILDPEQKDNLIIFERNTYAWNNNIPMTVDIEQFDENYRLAVRSTASEEDEVRYFLNAISLYQGEFLPKSSYSSWVISKNVYYAGLYNECILRVAPLLSKDGDYEQVMRICEHAVELYPFEEQVHRLLLEAYLKQKQPGKALRHYQHTLELFYRELNVNLTEAFKDLYDEISSGVNRVEYDLNIIKQDLRETEEASGAFLCNYDVFKSLYRLQARSMMRTGQSVYVALFTLNNRLGDSPSEKVLQNTMPILQECVIGSLRKGDIVSKYSPAQYVVILPLTNFENGEKVLKRISNKFKLAYHGKEVVLSTRLKAIEPVK